MEIAGDFMHHRLQPGPGLDVFLIGNGNLIAESGKFRLQLLQGHHRTDLFEG